MKISSSFIQGQSHCSKSARFQPIQPSKIATVLDAHGFDLVHLKTGKSKSIDRQDFQTTVARYRSRDGFAIEGLGFDLIFKVPHLYGALQGVLGLFRGTCSNQLNVGMHFETIKVKHLNNPIQELDDLIPKLVSQRKHLIDTIKTMQSRNVTSQEIMGLAQEVAAIRLNGVDNVAKIELHDLIKVRRQNDAKNDLFTAFNVIQENALRFGFRYYTNSIDQRGALMVRRAMTRKIKDESVKAIDLNSSIWDAATKLIAS